MKILLFIDSLGGGGSQRQLVNLAVGLKQRGNQVTVITYAEFDNHLARLTAAGVNYSCLNKTTRFDLKPVAKLVATIKTLSPAIVIAFLRTPSIYAELARLLTPQIPLVVSERAGLLNGKLRTGDKVGGLLHHIACEVVANSQAYADGLTQCFPTLKKKTSVVYNGVDAVFFQNGQKRINNNQQRLEKIRFCVVAARPGIEKGAITLVKALAELRSNGLTHFHIDWIGPADENDEQVKATNALLADLNLANFWTWAGHKDDIASSYQHYDALLSPSHHEGVPNVVCEAMASALPVIVTKIGDNTTIVGEANYKLCCEPNNPNSLYQCLSYFLTLNQDTRNSIGKNLHQRACTLFDIETYIDHWETVIERHT